MGSGATKILPFPLLTPASASTGAEAEAKAGAAEEEELLARLAARDRGALTHVYRRYHARVRAVARGLLQDPSAAEDVVHDTFVALPAASARFRGEASLGTFLASIAVNLCRRRRRSAERGQRAAERLHAEQLHHGRVVEEVPPPEAEARRRRLADRLARGLRRLPEDLREAFVLCAIEERTSPEAAELLGVADGTVRRRLFEARKRLRVLLDEEELR